MDIHKLFNYVLVVLGVILFLVIIFLRNKLLSKAKHEALLPHNIWENVFISAISGPSSFLILLLVTNYALELIGGIYNNYHLSTINSYIKSLGIIVVISWFFFNLIRELKKNYISSVNKKVVVDIATTLAVEKLSKVAVLIIAVISTLQVLGYSLTGLLTLGGVGSLIIGFAAKDILSNFLGGLTVHLDGPFTVGDAIRTDNKLEGTVESIGWRCTVLRNPEQSPVHIPNSVWLTVPVENVSRMLSRRVKENISLRYKDASKLKAIIWDLEQQLRKHQGINQAMPVIIRFNEFAPYALNLLLIVHTLAIKFESHLATKQDILFIVITTVKKHGADFAFPTTTINLPETSRDAVYEVSQEGIS